MFVLGHFNIYTRYMLPLGYTTCFLLGSPTKQRKFHIKTHNVKLTRYYRAKTKHVSTLCVNALDNLQTTSTDWFSCYVEVVKCNTW